ncbi:hypothetical protein HMPREF3156_01959 [Neisseria sp. HMSC06F02]|nr:hypothetical protein [Neisseria sicca]KJJ14555.1 hypothetical protein HMPREF3156_01959 [Neisseria sp. HMSC06F02]
MPKRLDDVPKCANVKIRGFRRPFAGRLKSLIPFPEALEISNI